RWVLAGALALAGIGATAVLRWGNGPSSPLPRGEGQGEGAVSPALATASPVAAPDSGDQVEIVATGRPHPDPLPEGEGTVAIRPPKRAHPQKLEPMRIGYLTADAVPWAHLVVDGKEVETTPVSRYPMKVGHYTLVFAGPDGREERRKVTIEEGKTAT